MRIFLRNLSTVVKPDRFQEIKANLVKVLNGPNQNPMKCEALLFKEIWCMNEHDKKLFQENYSSFVPPTKQNDWKWISQVNQENISKALKEIAKKKRKLNQEIIEFLTEDLKSKGEYGMLLEIFCASSGTNGSFYTLIDEIITHVAQRQNKSELQNVLGIILMNRSYLDYPLMKKIIHGVKSINDAELNEFLYENLPKFSLPRQSIFYLKLIDEFKDDDRLIKLLKSMAAARRVYLAEGIYDEETDDKLVKPDDEMFWFLERSNFHAAMSLYHKMRLSNPTLLTTTLYNRLLDYFLVKDPVCAVWVFSEMTLQNLEIPNDMITKLIDYPDSIHNVISLFASNSIHKNHLHFLIEIAFSISNAFLPALLQIYVDDLEVELDENLCLFLLNLAKEANYTLPFDDFYMLLRRREGLFKSSAALKDIIYQLIEQYEEKEQAAINELI